jgi:hypothetical protein
LTKLLLPETEPRPRLDDPRIADEPMLPRYPLVMPPR